MVLQRNVGLLSSRVSENQNIDGGCDTQASAYLTFLLPVQSDLEEAYIYVFQKKLLAVLSCMSQVGSHLL